MAADVGRALGLSLLHGGIGHHLRRLGEDERASLLKTEAGIRANSLIVSESGLYALILRSRKPEAQRFRKWVTSEVLPAIRRTGGYAGPARPSRRPRLRRRPARPAPRTPCRPSRRP